MLRKEVNARIKGYVEACWSNFEGKVVSKKQFKGFEKVFDKRIQRLAHLMIPETKKGILNHSDRYYLKRSLRIFQRKEMVRFLKSRNVKFSSSLEKIIKKDEQKNG